MEKIIILLFISFISNFSSAQDTLSTTSSSDTFRIKTMTAVTYRAFSFKPNSIINNFHPSDSTIIQYDTLGHVLQNRVFAFDLYSNDTPSLILKGINIVYDTLSQKRLYNMNLYFHPERTDTTTITVDAWDEHNQPILLSENSYDDKKLLQQFIHTYSNKGQTICTKVITIKTIDSEQYEEIYTYYYEFNEVGQPVKFIQQFDSEDAPIYEYSVTCRDYDEAGNCLYLLFKTPDQPANNQISSFTKYYYEYFE